MCPTGTKVILQTGTHGYPPRGGRQPGRRGRRQRRWAMRYSVPWLHGQQTSRNARDIRGLRRHRVMQLPGEGGGRLLSGVRVRLPPIIDRDLPHCSLLGRLPRSTVTPPPSQGSYMDIALTCHPAADYRVWQGGRCLRRIHRTGQHVITCPVTKPISDRLPQTQAPVAGLSGGDPS